jgi:photosystem II stability/assembly factor-like uncharacterized protein
MADGSGGRRVSGSPIRILRLTCAWLSCLATIGLGMTLTIQTSSATPPSPSGWQVVAQFPPGGTALTGISCPSIDDCYAVGLEGVIEATTDGGGTWVSQSAPADTGGLHGVDCISSTSCLAVGSTNTIGAAAGAIISTVDGGETWTDENVPSGIAGFSSVACPSAVNCFATGLTSEGDPVIVATTNRGGMWTNQNLPSELYSPDAIACTSISTCYAVGTDTLNSNDASILVTTDGGTTWVGQIPAGIGPLAGVACTSPATCFAVVGGGVGSVSIIGTTDGWTTASSDPLTQSTPGQYLLAGISCPTASDCYAVGAGGSGAVNFNSTDGGQTWNPQPPPSFDNPTRLFGVSCAAAMVCFASGNGTSGEVNEVESYGNPSISTTAAPSGHVGSPYSFTLEATGSAGFTWSLVSGSLPDGLSLSAGGVISGTPTLGQEAAFEVQVEDSGDRQVDASLSLQIVPPSSYTPLTPVRICDTRVSPFSPFNQCNNGVVSPSGPVGAGATKVLNVANAMVADGVPSNATAVVLNVTAVNAAAPGGFMTVFPTGTPEPNASNLNYSAGEVVPNLVEVGVGMGGDVSFASSSQTDLIVDLEGYTSAAGAGLYSALSPTRICDTRVSGSATPSNQCDNGMAQAAGRVTAASPLTINVANDGTSFGVPAGATAAVLNVTDTNPAASGFVTIYPQGTSEPNASNLNFSAGQTTANRVIVPLSTSGASAGDVTMATSTPTDLVVDVSGYYSASGAQFSAEPAPVRICDTRPVTSFSPQNQCSGHPIGAGTPNQLAINVRGLAGVPNAATAVVLNLTGIGPTQATFLTVFPGGAVPNASDLNLSAGETRPNLVVATVNPTNGKVTIWNQAGTLNVIVDVLGWYS